MIAVQTIYNRVCNFILEPGGLQTGVLTEQQILDYLAEVVGEFLDTSGLYMKIFAQLSQSGTSIYPVPDQLTSVTTLFVNERILSPETSEDLDLLLRYWRKAQPAVPRYWHEDRLPSKTIEVVPAPNYEGQYFSVNTLETGYYGTLSAASTFSANTPFYGTLSSFTGPVYLGTTMPIYGTISAIYPSTGNVMMIGPAKLLPLSLALTDNIPFVPPIWMDYLMYGVLRKVFSDNAETKDETRAQYCDQRWKEGLSLAHIVGEEVLGLQWASQEDMN